MRHRRSLITLAVVALLLIALSTTASAATYPNSIASTGDSITRAFNTGFFPFTDAPANSWSTGTNLTVSSHYLRLLALTPSISGKNYNDARSGARMADLSGQMTLAGSQHVKYVTVLMGGNDVCASNVDTMTPVQTFHNQFAAAMGTVVGGLPNVRVFVASIPDVYHLWELFHDNATAVFVWSVFRICQSLLANPQSTAQPDVDRRAAVRQRNIDFNTQLALVCAAYLQCRFDGGAVFNYAYAAADVSTRDYFHPSLTGQARLASVTWAASYWGP